MNEWATAGFRYTPDQRPQVSLNTALYRDTTPPCGEDRGGCFCTHRGGFPPTGPLYQTLWSGHSQLLMNWTGGSTHFRVCWLKWRREFQSGHRGGVRAVIPVTGPFLTTTNHSTQLCWRANGPQWTGVNTSSKGSDAYQIRGEQSRRRGERGALFSPTEQNFNFKESFLH